MKRLLRYFVQGLILTVPAVVTGYVCYGLFVRVDSWLHLPVPGAGFVLTISAITLIGFLGPTFLSKPLVEGFEKLIERLPFVRLLYHSTKDLLNAFVGEKRRFDKPVIVALSLMDNRPDLAGNSALKQCSGGTSGALTAPLKPRA